MEIKNSGTTPIAVITGDPAAPTDVKVLKAGEAYHTDVYPATVVDDSYADLKNRRAPDQPASGRRKADPNFDQRQIKKAAPEKEAKSDGKKDADKSASKSAEKSVA